jgi:anti-sigma regulatory factor (Ser/Thr protein kinase)
VRVGEVQMTSLRVPFDPASVSGVRSTLTADLAAQGGVTPEQQDAAALIVSELLTNSIQHAQPLGEEDLQVTWEVEDEGLRISVTDGGGTGLPTQKTASSVALGGRGLQIVDALAQHWWVETNDAMATVHALVAW